MKLRVIVLGSVLLAATVAALPQSFTATLTGTVTDPSNKVVFGAPDTNLNSSQLGKITTQTNPARKIQFSARLMF